MNALPTVNFLRRAKDTFRVVKDRLHTMTKIVKFCFFNKFNSSPFISIASTMRQKSVYDLSLRGARNERRGNLKSLKRDCFARGPPRPRNDKL